ncbi:MULTISPECIES: endonuclease/exonuclease/phosphatase family protein [Paenibacillus]|uniref:endonuclease/exonuclease/phosphatase family protein n=1 Tax=Paenibacillus TaxID=44249 RepID=UPI0003859E92|nr:MULTISPECIES: endonuclease/exonuclease/phosphatase family protein [Paenibacillus]EPY13095.1 hypothetical protein PAAL66ix_08601 [Paenibacillus alvei A6-6i-x]
MSKHLSLLTWNMYLGADTSPLFTAPPVLIPERVTEVFRQFLATNILTRVKSIARQIASKKPDFISLQEAERIQLVIPSFRTVTYDFISLLLKELRELGLRYEVAAVNHNFSAELPDSHGNTVRFLDRDAILIRTSSKLKIVQKTEANFNTNLVIQIGGQPFVVVRGWSSIGVCWHGRTFRIINTHLEPLSPAIQVAQAQEIIDGPGNSQLPLIVTGDLNSNADGTGTPTYGLFLADGFHDTWVEVGKGNGFTCCQDADLLNNQSSLLSRIDYILFKNGWIPLKADNAGEKQQDRTETGLWPSDHAGVSAALKLNKNCY